MNRPITTLFMLMSLDGKISTGENDSLDFDSDLPNGSGVKEGLHQYYEIEQSTDLWSFNTGRVQAKTGANQKEISPDLTNNIPDCEEKDAFGVSVSSIPSISLNKKNSVSKMFFHGL